MNHVTFCTLFTALAASTVFADVEEFHSPTSKWSYDFLGTPKNISASVNGNTFASCWDIGNGSLIASVHDSSSGDFAAGTSLATVPALESIDLAWSQQAGRLAVGYLSTDGFNRTRLIDIVTSLPIGFEHPGSRVAFDESGSLLVVGGSDAYVRLIDAKTGQVIRAFPFDGQLLDVAIDSTGGVVGASGKSGIIELWDTATMVSIFRIDQGDMDISRISISPGCTYVGGGTDSLLNPDEETPADNGTALVWQVSDGTLVGERVIAPGGISKVAWMDSEFELLVLGRDSDMVPIITAWDIAADRTVVAISPSELLDVDEVSDFDYEQHSNVWAVSTSSGTLMAFEAGSDCLSDLTGNSFVDGQDLAKLLSEWGNTFTSADQNGDGQVNGADLSILIGAWGSCSD
jgi:WD40 repeat protein